MITKIADEIKIVLVTAVCVFGIAIIFKNVLHIQPDFIILNSPVYLFIVYIITRSQTKKLKYDKPLYWSLAIIFITLFTIALYTIQR